MTRIEFPNEPIRVNAGEWVTPRPLTALERQEEAEYEAILGNDEREPCDWCDGDGVIVCDGGVDCPEADDAGCPFVDFHTCRCSDCGGYGYFELNVGAAL